MIDQPEPEFCARCLGEGCDDCAGTGYGWIPKSTPLPSSEEAPQWRCNVRRSHGYCNAINEADDDSCGACGESIGAVEFLRAQLQTALSERDEARAKLKRHGFTSDDVRQP